MSLTPVQAAKVLPFLQQYPDEPRYHYITDLVMLRTIGYHANRLEGNSFFHGTATLNEGHARTVYLVDKAAMQEFVRVGQMSWQELEAERQRVKAAQEVGG